MTFERKRDRENKVKRYIGYKNGLEINADIAARYKWTIQAITDRGENQ